METTIWIYALILLMTVVLSPAIAEPQVRQLPCHSLTTIPDTAPAQFVFVSSGHPGDCSFIFEGLMKGRLELTVRNLKTNLSRGSDDPCDDAQVNIFNFKSDGQVNLAKKLCDNDTDVTLVTDTNTAIMSTSLVEGSFSVTARNVDFPLDLNNDLTELTPPVSQFEDWFSNRQNVDIEINVSPPTNSPSTSTTESPTTVDPTTSQPGTTTSTPNTTGYPQSYYRKHNCSYKQINGQYVLVCPETSPPKDFRPSQPLPNYDDYNYHNSRWRPGYNWKPGYWPSWDYSNGHSDNDYQDVPNIDITYQNNQDNQAYPGYEAPQNSYQPPSHNYGPPSHNYGPPSPTYGPPSYTYGPPPSTSTVPSSTTPTTTTSSPTTTTSSGYTYGPPSYTYGPPSYTYGPPSYTYGPPSYTYGPPSHTYGPPSFTYGPPSNTYGPPDYSTQGTTKNDESTSLSPQTRLTEVTTTSKPTTKHMTKATTQKPTTQKQKTTTTTKPTVKTTTTAKPTTKKKEMTTKKHHNFFGIPLPWEGDVSTSLNPEQNEATEPYTPTVEEQAETLSPNESNNYERDSELSEYL